MAYIGRGIDNISQIEVLDLITFTNSAGPYNILKGAVAFIPSTVNSLLIEVDGIIQAPASYTVDGSTITFGVSMASTSTMNSMIHFGTGLITTPADLSVTSAKIASDAVTTAKILDDNITTAKILDNNVTVAKLPTTLDISGNTVTLPASVSGLGTGITNAQLAGSIDVTSKITGIVPTANLGSGSASASTYLAGNQTYQTITPYNDDALQNDIATLALHQATNANAAKYNLANTNVDVYQDSTGVASFTDCARDATGEYISSVQTVSGNDSDTTFLLSNDTNPATDISGTAMAVTSSGLTYSSTYSKFGTYSWQFPGTSGNRFEFGSASTSEHEWFGTSSSTAANATLELWFNTATEANTGTRFWSKVTGASYQNYVRPNGNFYYTGLNNDPSLVGNNSWIETDSDFHHYAWDNYNNILKFYVDGVLKETTGTNSGTPSSNNAAAMRFGCNESNAQQIKGYIDTIRVSKVSRYLGAASFTPPTTATYDSTTVNATGNYVSTATTANASVSKVGIVITYKNNAGTNTLNTDIVAQVSADGGSNYSTVTLAAAGTFATGVLQAVANDVSVTAGTSIQYKISFANQASGSKEARITGVSLIY